MKIASSDIQFASQHRSISEHTLQESLRTWTGDKRPDFEGREARANAGAAASDAVTLSRQAVAAMREQQATEASSGGRGASTPEGGVSTQAAKEATNDAEDGLGDTPQYRLLMLLVERLTGRKIRLVRADDLTRGSAPVAASPDARSAAPAPQGQAAEPPKRAGYGVEYDRHEVVHEAETTTFAAQGVVQTTDGQEIAFAVGLTMSRDYRAESNVSVRLGDAVVKDPLVINFGGTAAQLTEAKFSFDLDADGSAESVSFVGPGSGFLALDKNGDGKIGDGSELFGASTGNGFAELAAYDQDHNGWIDENDAAYQKLSVWTRDAAGRDTYRSLAQANVGALSVGSVDTAFDLKNAANRLDGQVRATGVYLSESGAVGTLQQVDLALGAVGEPPRS